MERSMAGAQLLGLILVGVVAGSFVGTQLGQVRVQKRPPVRGPIQVAGRVAL